MPIGELPPGTPLVAYAGLIAVVGYAARRRRARLAETGVRGRLPNADKHPHDLAFLSGSAEWAVCSALSAMHLRGTVTAGGGVVRSAGSVGDCRNELERAIHTAAGSGIRVRRLAHCPEVARAFRSVEKRLAHGDLMLSDARSRPIRRVGLWMAPVAVLGALSVLTGTDVGMTIAFAVGTVVASLMTLYMLTSRNGRTVSGDEVLARLRAKKHAMSPAMAPDWTVHGPKGAALAVGIFGPEAVWASAPVFAADLGLVRWHAAIVVDGDGGGCGGGCGGCGG